MEGKKLLIEKRETEREGERESREWVLKGKVMKGKTV